MKQKIFLLFLLFSTLNNYAQLSDSEYQDRCDKEFQSLCNLLPKGQEESWIIKARNIDIEYIKIGKEKQKEEEVYKKLNAEAIYAVQYLNSINNFLLPAKTKLVNSLADKIVKIKIGSSIESKIDSLDRVFNDYANTNKAKNFEKAYDKFLSEKSKYLKIKSERDTLFYTVYEVKSNVYSDPDSKDIYAVFNWKVRIEKLNKLKTDFDNISEEVKSKQFLVVKDPNPIVPLLFQFCTLLVVISGVFVNFAFEKKRHKIVLILVLSSLITAIILLFVSDNTFLNTAVNILVPGIGYIIFYYKKKRS
ncbi:MULTISPECIES: hypothetical protein [Flavobacterium]|jgi:hypothetical protein|uniref:Uncharacterized protein n=2 Tax=Flavobacterium TaxID=237 RepID=A0A085ZZI1_FLAHY|nr:MULTISPECIES: hypothetical protein [Flavobacterium]KFF09845.1 hypothetical protein IW20_22305 [Flavobacterium hydatis]MDL2142767.1 hypothetical protein [Flavobacterium tructae]OHT43730.1 hypothetical protein BHE19_15355 [Flavobacterium tructae]OXA87320.1 hypothetical protein B0A62_22830 [Flavobacterium hydatis]OXB20499.1 hypothetical protein B0A71_06740 [Flavobacterium tructae]